MVYIISYIPRFCICAKWNYNFDVSIYHISVLSDTVLHSFIISFIVYIQQTSPIGSVCINEEIKFTCVVSDATRLYFIIYNYTYHNCKIYILRWIRYLLLAYLSLICLSRFRRWVRITPATRLWQSKSSKETQESHQ